MNTVKIEMPDLAFLMLLVGRRKSGKSSLCIDLLTNPKMLLGKFDKVILISPTADIDETWLNSQIDFNHPQIVVYTEFKQEHIAEIISDQRLSIDLNGSENADDVLLILDDCLADAEFKQKSGNHLFKISNNGRHLKISIIILAQKITGIPTEIRSQADSMLLFACNSDREVQNIQQDCSIDKEVFRTNTDRIYSFVHCLNKGGRMHVFNSNGKRIN